MASGLQLPGAPSYASRLRGEAPPCRSSRIGKNGGMLPPDQHSTFQNKKDNAYVSSNAGKHLSTPSNQGMYAQAHTRIQKPVTADRGLPSGDSWKDDSANAPRTKSRLPKDESWKNNAASTVQTKSRLSRLPEDGSWKADPAGKLQTNSQDNQNVAGGDAQQGITDSMASLSFSASKNAEAVPLGRCLAWERPVFTSSTNSKASKYKQRSDRDYPKPTPSAYSISYKRSYNQTPMEQAAYREYLPFLKSEFKVGMILRMNIHESDFKGTSKAAIAQASQASTLVDGGRRRKEHRYHGDFGPIYSENRIFIVVNVAEDVYTAIPLFTHEGKGLANILDKKSWVSVEDHRQLGKCIQQSEHQPLRTAFLSPECDKLDPVNTAWIPFALPCRYDVPVAYQGKLDKASAKRLVRLHRETWVDDQSDED